MGLWRCPNCGREFSHRGQSHSCVTIAIEDHFQNRPEELQSLFDDLIAELSQTGPVRVDAVQTAINLGGRRHYAMVYVQRDGLRVEFGLSRPLRDRRISRVEALGETYYLHHVKLTSSEDLDDQFLDWMREAQTMGGSLDKAVT